MTHFDYSNDLNTQTFAGRRNALSPLIHKLSNLKRTSLDDRTDSNHKFNTCQSWIHVTSDFQFSILFSWTTRVHAITINPRLRWVACVHISAAHQKENGRSSILYNCLVLDNSLPSHSLDSLGKLSSSQVKFERIADAYFTSWKWGSRKCLDFTNITFMNRYPVEYELWVHSWV